MKKMTQYQVQVAAEAFAAGAIAHVGCNVSVQYGAQQPGYDLLADKNGKILKIQVKGSQDGSWGLTQSLKAKRDYHAAAHEWVKKQGKKTVFMLIQFKNVEPGQSPRIYLAAPTEIAKRLKESSRGRGDTILYEYKAWAKRAHGHGTIDKIPQEWRFSEKRVNDFFRKHSV